MRASTVAIALGFPLVIMLVVAQAVLMVGMFVFRAGTRLAARRWA